MFLHHLKYVLIGWFLAFCGNILLAQNDYSSLTLKQSLNISVNKNLFLKADKINADISQSDIVTAGLRPNPVFNNQTLQLLSPNHKMGDSKYLLSSHNRQVWYQVTMPIQLMDVRNKKIDFATRNFEITQKNYLESVRNQYYNVANQWLKIWKIKMENKILLEAKETVDTLVHINTNRYKNQAITPIELIRTQLLSDQYRLQLKTLKIDFETSLREFSMLLGDTSIFDIEENDDFVTMETSTMFDSLYEAAKVKRQDYQISNLNIELANSNVTLQNALKAPYLELGAIFNPQNLVPYAGFFATVSIPIFDKNQGEIQKSKYYVDQSKVLMQQKELEVKKTIFTALENYKLNKSNMTNTVSMVLKASTVLNTVRYSYLKGNTSILDFLEAQRSMLETQRMYYESVYNYRISYIELLNATGLIVELTN